MKPTAKTNAGSKLLSTGDNRAQQLSCSGTHPSRLGGGKTFDDTQRKPYCGPGCRPCELAEDFDGRSCASNLAELGLARADETTGKTG